MKAIRIHEYGGKPQIDEIAAPHPKPNEVVVRNAATSFNPIDPGRASGVMRQIFPLQFPWIPGGDVSGAIEEVGSAVSDLEKGDSVFGYSMVGGAYAELVAIHAGAVTRHPPTMSAEQAASVAGVGQTALQMLAIAQVQAGQTILVQGGSGGVGTLVIQLAHKLGARVITTARKGQESALLQLGADQVIVAENKSPAENEKEIDVVLDLVGGDSLARAYALVKPGVSL